MDLPGFKLHPLGGPWKGEWAVWVTGNWRVVFMFDNEGAVQVDLEDYH
jgi:toxin HigB-1